MALSFPKETTFIHKSHKIKSFYSASILLLVFNNLAAGINYLFQCVMGHHLSTSDFGLMNSLFQLSGFMALPVSIYAAIMTRHWAELSHVANHDEINETWYSFSILTIGICLIISLAAFLCTPWISWWLKTENVWAIHLMIFGTCIMTILSLATPFAMARQWFSLLAFGALSGTLLRLGIAWWGIKTNIPLYGGVVGFCSIGITLFICVSLKTRWPGWSHLHFKKLWFKKSEWMSSVMLGLGSFFILGSDLLVVQRVYEPHEAGLFAQVTVLARIIFYLVGPLASIVLPKSATSLLEDQQPTEKKVLKRALQLSFLILVLAGIVISFLAPLAFKFLRGNVDAEAVFYLRIAVWCFIPISLCQLIIPSLFASRQEKTLVQFTSLSALLPVGIALFHHELIHAFLVEGSVGLLLLIYVLIRRKFFMKSKI
jgi:O-antigen/teichoic acid export membrane protein